MRTAKDLPQYIVPRTSSLLYNMDLTVLWYQIMVVDSWMVFLLLSMLCQNVQPRHEAESRSLWMGVFDVALTYSRHLPWEQIAVSSAEYPSGA